MALALAYESLVVDEKQREITALAKSLSTADARSLLAAINYANANFKCDIVGKVPAELLGLIAQHLSVKDSSRAQQVSKLWRERLSAPSLVVAKLLPWHAEYLLSPNSDPTIVYRSKLAWSHGRPFQHKQICVEPDRVELTYSQGMLGWFSDDRRSLDVYQIARDRLSRITTSNREEIYQFGTSSSMLAIITGSGKCCVWTIDDLHDDPAHIIRLESASVHKVIVTRTAVILTYRTRIQLGYSMNCEIAHSHMQGSKQSYLHSMLVWVPSTQQIKQFSLPYARQLNYQDPFISDKEMTITIIGFTYSSESQSGEEAEKQVHIIIYNFEGQLLKERTQLVNMTNYAWRRNNLMNDYNDSTIIAYKCVQELHKWSMDLCLYSRRTISLQWQTISGPGMMFLGKVSVFMHRDIIFFQRSDGKVLVVDQSDPDLCKVHSTYYQGKYRESDRNCKVDFIGDDDDDNFLLVDYRDGQRYDLLCFNSLIAVRDRFSVLDIFKKDVSQLSEE